MLCVHYQQIRNKSLVGHVDWIHSSPPITTIEATKQATNLFLFVHQQLNQEKLVTLTTQQTSINCPFIREDERCSQ